MNLYFGNLSFRLAAVPSVVAVDDPPKFQKKTITSSMYTDEKSGFADGLRPIKAFCA